ncbi:MAG: class I SAM-dependent methyltransferase [Alphaproteobacteria bacterium]|jgi:16S rRNA (guanine1516-N2)-methyltransferase|nr:class I SAM-dependent methyltransferase [Alphaproteobacteria bacterium]
MKHEIKLIEIEHKLYLHDVTENLKINIDFVKFCNSNRGKSLKKEGLVKALGKISDDMHIYDLTAGLGRDAMVMALLGHQVTMLEQNKLLYEMLSAAQHDLANSAYQDVAKNLTLLNQDSKEFCANLTYCKTNIFYLDPMFPMRSKSAKVKKELQILQKICATENKLENFIELVKSKGKVVLKRPKFAPELKVKAHHIIKGSKIDFYVF